MRILIDARESGTSTGRYVDKLVEYLHKLKPEHEIILLAKSHRLNFFVKIALNFQVIKSDYKEFTIDEQLALLRQIKSLNPDLVHFSMTQQPILYRGQKITTIHDLTTLRFYNPAKNRLIFKFKQQVYKQVVKSAAKRSRCIITPSQYVKKDVAQFAKINPRKIAVIYEAADRIKAPAKPVSRLAGKQFIMYVGRALPHKNLGRLVEAYSLLRNNHPELMLVFVGKTDANYKKISALVSDRRLAHSIIFTDFIEEGELRWLYENTAAYVFPSLSEGFGLPPLEAMAHGAPVISSNASCLPEINGKAAHYFDPVDINDIARAIDDVLNNKVSRANLVSSGHSQLAKYSWRKTAEQTLKVYELVLKNN
jgi:glycosyltransferase involved in cell wall biosynthesis